MEILLQTCIWGLDVHTRIISAQLLREWSQWVTQGWSSSKYFLAVKLFILSCHQTQEQPKGTSSVLTSFLLLATSFFSERWTLLVPKKSSAEVGVCFTGERGLLLACGFTSSFFPVFVPGQPIADVPFSFGFREILLLAKSSSSSKHKENSITSGTWNSSSNNRTAKRTILAHYINSHPKIMLQACRSFLKKRLNCTTHSI